ncbi:uncharacterized protein LOC133364303 isoform X2 [Rhineura floridana]|uniref:uncharacterized protein LOC133364303 isoform X2 n=1 Tax=Rhineura floridana TaxID=261503 RepID=UPI002AC840BA|nr:uncharacterized protein LOC133364303 isoform X2 [Rhineura floridana]
MSGERNGVAERRPADPSALRNVIDDLESSQVSLSSSVESSTADQAGGDGNMEENAESLDYEMEDYGPDGPLPAIGRRREARILDRWKTDLQCEWGCYDTWFLADPGNRWDMLKLWGFLAAHLAVLPAPTGPCLAKLSRDKILDWLDRAHPAVLAALQGNIKGTTDSLAMHRSVTSGVVERLLIGSCARTSTRNLPDWLEPAAMERMVQELIRIWETPAYASHCPLIWTETGRMTSTLRRQDYIDWLSHLVGHLKFWQQNAQQQAATIPRKSRVLEMTVMVMAPRVDPSADVATSLVTDDPGTGERGVVAETLSGGADNRERQTVAAEIGWRSAVPPDPNWEITARNSCQGASPEEGPPQTEYWRLACRHRAYDDIPALGQWISAQETTPNAPTAARAITELPFACKSIWKLY